MGKNVVVIGAQWGDEGKGKIVDWLTEQASGVVRFNGGHNAGHTLVINGKKTILRLIQENPISRQETLLEYLSKEGFDATQATISRDIREMNLVKAATPTGYRYISSHSEALNPKMQARFETIFHESVLGVDFAGHVVLVKCYSGMANAACEVFDALKWKNVVGTLSGDDTFLIVARSERDAKTICTELGHYIGQK